jgi:hypothetical protein
VPLSAKGAFYTSLGQRPRKKIATNKKGLKARSKVNFETASKLPHSIYALIETGGGMRKTIDD